MPAATSTKNINELKFVRLKIPQLIPKDLIEAVKGRTFSSDEFIAYQQRNINSSSNLLYALVDQHAMIQGYLWAELNQLDKTLFINTLSVSKDYWGKGAAIHKAIEFVADLKKNFRSPRVLWCTTNEKFFAKKGFRRSKIVLMEFADRPQEDLVEAFSQSDPREIPNFEHVQTG